MYHLEAAGRDNWHKMRATLDRIEQTRARGLQVTADIYPYTAGMTSLSACIPPRYHDGGVAALRGRLADPALRADIARDIVVDSGTWENLYLAAGGASGILLLGGLENVDASVVGPTLSAFKGHLMAKAALEAAALDAELRAAGLPLARYLGATRDRAPCGVSVGIMDSVPTLIDAVAGYLHERYQRIKLKIGQGWDVEPVRAVRERFGDILLQVDANAAYTLGEARQLAKLDPFDLLLTEQPLAEDDVRGHAELARMLRTPICLDESITSARGAADAIALGACRIVNIKPGRVGGYLAVPNRPGIGVEPIAEILDSVTTSKQWLPNSGG